MAGGDCGDGSDVAEADTNIEVDTDVDASALVGEFNVGVLFGACPKS